MRIGRVYATHGWHPPAPGHVRAPMKALSEPQTQCETLSRPGTVAVASTHPAAETVEPP